MDLITVRELYRNREEYLDKEISVGGWVRSVRGSKAFGFIVVSDGSYFEPLQVVYHDTLANFNEISKLNVGAAIIEEAPHSGISAYHHASSCPYQYLPGRIPCTLAHCLRDPSVFPGAGFCLCPHPADYRK